MLTLENSGPLQMGFWLPNRIWATAKYLVPLRKLIDGKRKSGTLKPLIPEVKEFKAWVTGHSVYRMWVNSMIEQANDFIKNNTTPKEQKEIEKDGDVLWLPHFDALFETINEIIITSPSFNNTAQVGTPLNGLLAVAMATEAGVALFHDTTFNEQFKKVLNAWNRFLKSKTSLDKLDIKNPEKEGSWISTAAWNAGVWTDMEFNKNKPGYGFDSWNSFFIRKFVSGARPFKGSGKDICIGCETTPWEYAKDIKRESNFWIKDADYSLLDLFAGDDKWAKLFEGGQLYQGFLSATHYHRWNCPMDGKIVRSWVQPGTYFAQRPAQRENQGTWEGTESQPYLGHVAARAVFIFQHPVCGYVALICIGMVEVSTCVMENKYKVKEGAKPVPVKKGVEIGHFEFGGSTHAMIFQKDKVKLEKWALDAVKHRNDPNPTPMGTVIATPR